MPKTHGTSGQRLKWLRSSPREITREVYQRPVFANGRFTATVPLMQLIAFAYYLPLNPSPRLSGGPDWIRCPEAFYEIKAIYSIR